MSAPSAWILPEPGAVLGLLGLGVWTALDQSACLQILVSQPLVASWLGGWMVGDPGAGLALGVLLQGVWSRALPMGASPLPVVGPAAVVGGALAALCPGSRWALGPVLSVPEAFPLALVLALCLALGEGARPFLQGIYRRRGLGRVERAAEHGDARGLQRAHLLGLLPTAGLGVFLVALGLVLGAGLLRGAGSLPHADGRWVALPVLGVGIGQTTSLAVGRRAWIWGTAALAVGLAALFA
jgi:mannose PTS system EIIC component